MATTSLWKVDKRLDHVIDYATDEEKISYLKQQNELLHEWNRLTENQKKIIFQLLKEM